MKFDIDSARKAGYSDDEIADYLATENKFDLSGAIESGYSSREVIDFLTQPRGGKQDLPADVTPSKGRSATPMGQADPRIVDNRGLIERVADYLKPAPKSVLEDYVPTAEERQAEIDRRLSYGAGPISTETAAKADLVRSGMAKPDSRVVQKVATAMEEQGAPSFGDLIEIAKSPINERAARDTKAEEFRTPGEWAVDTLSNIGQGAVGLVQLPVNIIAPSSEIAKTLRDTQKELQNAESDVLRASREQLKDRVLTEEGFFDRYVATVKELVTNPTLSISEAAKQVPNFLGIVGAARLAGAATGGAVSLAGRASPTLALGEAISGGAIQTAARAAGTTAGGAGASMVMAGGDAAGNVYETLTDRNQTPMSVWKQNPDFQKLVADGKSEKQAIEEIATTKARMAALITAPLGLLGYAGAEAAIASKGLGRATAEALTARGMAKTAAKDLAGEQLEEGGTQFGGNVISKTVNPNQSLTEGVPEAMGTALVTSAPFAAAGVRSQYKEAMQGNEDQTIAARVGDMIIGQERQDPRLINPMDTIRTEDQVGPNAPSRAGQMMSFTEPDSATAQAGLTPIVVPVPAAPVAPTADLEAVTLPEINASTEQQFGLDKLRMGATNVSTAGAVDAQPSVGGIAGSDQLGGGVDLSRPDVTVAAGSVRGSAGEPAADAGQAVAAGVGAGQQAAGVTPQQNNIADISMQPWAGRAGNGYLTEQAAEQGRATASAVLDTKDTHEWRVERMESGRYQLVPYLKETTLGTQAPQAVQAEAQGQKAAAGAGAIAAAGAAATSQLQDRGVPRLTFAQTATPDEFSVFQRSVAEDGIQIAPLRLDEMNNTHKLASVVAQLLGKTYTVARVTSGDPMALPNGMVNKLGGKHIVAAENSEDAPLFVAIHEAYHGLPEQQRKALNTQLLQLFRAENKDRFLKEFNYSEAQFEEEAPAFIAQVVSKRADFWEELRTKMGNREFADVAKLVLGTLNQIVRKVTSQYGKDFADTYITDIVRARDLLTTAYAEAMREQGLQPDVEIDSAVMASNKADIGSSLQERVDNDFDALVQEYNALRGTEGGRILDTDIARELSPEYRADRSRSAEVHEAASAFIQKLFDTRMATGHDGEYVAFMAGGGGSGKSSAQSLLGEEFTGAATVLDGTLSSEAKARRNIQTVIDSGRAAVIMYVYREPVEALRNGVLTRAMRGGRTVPVDALVKGHAGASEVVRNLAKDYEGNPDVTIIAIDNSRGPGNIVRSDLANITPVIKSGLKERFINAATEEFQNGRVSETVYRATIGDARAPAQVAREDAQGGQGGRSEAGQGREPEGSRDAVTRSNRAKKAGSYTYTVDDKGRITVTGDADRIRFLTKAIAKGTVTPDGEAVMFRATEADAAIKALKSEPKADPTIAASIQKQLDLSNEELASTSLEYQTGEPKDRAFVAPLKGGVPETVQFLEERRRASGLRLLDIAKPEDQDTLAKLIAAETMAAIRSSGNALEWYDETIAKTLAMAAVKYPELGRDVNAQTAFRLGMAIASQGLNVENNLKLAMRQYEAFRNTGKFPEMGEGESAEAMAGNFRLANELMAEMGPDLFRRFLATPFTIGELNSAGFDPGGELVDEEVLGSSVFGPKIGFGFYSNLNGNFEPVTMDMWFMRTMGRLTGYLRAFDAEKFSGQIKRFRDSFDQRGADGVYADQFDADLLEAARTDQDSAIALARQVKKAHEKDFKTNREAFDAKQRKKTSLVLAAETMIQSIDKPKDVPGNGTERRQMRQVVRKAVDLVEQAYGQRVPPAAMQALIWYPEQELYKALGVKLSVTSQDYAGATEKVLKDEGYDEQQLRTAAKSGARRVRQANARDERRAAQGDGQRAGRSGPLEGAERNEFVRSRYEQAQLEKERLNPTRKGVVFEVAPDPNNEELTNRWRSLEQSQRLEISERVAREIVPKVLGQFQSSGIVAAQVGSYLDDTNPSFTVLLDKGDAVDIAKQLGFVLAQDSMMVVSPKPFKGGDKVGAIALELGDKTAAEVDQIYKTLREIEVNGTKPIAGQSMANGVMTILNYSDVSTQQLAILVDQKLNKRYTVMTRDVFAAFPEKKEYDYGRETDDGRGSRADLRKGARALRTEATAALERELAGVTVKRSNRTTGPAEPAGRSSARSDQGDGVKIAGAVHYAKQEGLSVLSGSRFGTGIKGAEQKRLSERGVDPRIKRRVYFYLPVEGGLPQAELGLGGFVYTADLSNLYDPSAGSRRFPTTPNEFESAVLDAGFRGYINREMGTAVVLDSDVPVKYQGPAAGQTIVQRTAQRAAPRVVTRTEGDELVRRPSGDEMTGIIKARPALAEAAPSFKLQFGEARVLASEAEAADRVLADAGAGFQFGEVMRSNRARDSWFLGRDELGRIKLGAGAKAYRAVADVASNVLDKVGMKPISTELGRAMRQMKVEIAQARETTAEVADKLKELSEQERAMISDVIEGELKRGVKPPKRVLEVAASMSDIMSEQTDELVRLGMLSADAAGRWDGKYLPRFYESKLKDEGKAWAKAAKALMGKPKTMQGIRGASLKGRGLFQTIPVEELEAWLAEGWEERDPNFDPDTDTEIVVWRDYTREERANMGEIRDAMFRFIMGYNKSQRDISLGRLYENLANTVASSKEKEGYVQVPRTNVEDTYARRYGKLAGKWVPKEVMDHLGGFDEANYNELLAMYRKAMGMWKEGKTVLNPVSHANNVLSNVTMAHFAGVSYWDVSKYLAATRDIVKNAPMLKEAKDAGLWLGTMNQSELVQMLPDQLKVLAAKSESKAGKAVDTVWNAMSFWLRKPMSKAYEAEDLFFRYLIYRDARQRGLEPADAVDYAQKYIFTYDDLPKGARRARDYALPFFAYTYKVVPALAQTALEQPWRLAAPAAVLYAANAAMYAIAAGAEDDDWMELIKRYVTDPDFREKARQLEADERVNLPPWMKGSTAIGTPKTVRLGTDEVTGLPVFLDVARIFPGGDLFDAHNNAGGVPLLAPITPNHPILTSAAALLFNKDTFRGTEIVKASDTDAEAAAKRAKWAYQQIAPAIAVGNSHFDRAMNVIANVTGEPVNLYFTEYTGVGKDGLPIQPGYAAMQTVGIKARPIDLETSAAIQKAQENKLVREIEAEIRSAQRLERKGALTSDQADRIIEKQKEKRQRLKEGLTVDGDERE